MFRVGRRGFAALALVFILVGVLVAEVITTVRNGRPYAKPTPGNGVFETLTSAADFSAGTFDGVRVDQVGAEAALVLEMTGTAPSGSAPAPSGSAPSPSGSAPGPASPAPASPSGPKEGTDPDGRYNGGTFLYGTYVSPVWNTGVAVNSVVASWNADTPEGTWVEVEARALIGGTWTKYYSWGPWASGTGTIRRHNAGAQTDSNGTVDTDDLMLSKPATAVQLRATLFAARAGLTPRVRRLSVVATGPGPAAGASETTPGAGVTARVAAPDPSPAAVPGAAPDPSPAATYRTARGIDLAVPERRQNDFPDGAGWCSPTSLSMVLAYWAERTGNRALDHSVPDTAAGVLDYAYGGTGNWTFNTAFAASLGLDTYVTRFSSFDAIEPWIAAGIPVIINIEFGTGQLAGAPMPSTDGHIIVIRGFDRKGNPIANDPASRADQEEKVRIVYDRAELERAWQGRPRGTVYIIYPPRHKTP